MRPYYAALIAACTISLGGCARDFQKEYIDLKDRFIKDTAFREAKIAECISGIRNTPGAPEKFALIMNMPKEKVPEIACARMSKAWIDGRMTAEIHIKFKKYGITSPESIRIVQGR